MDAVVRLPDGRRLAYRRRPGDAGRPTVVFECGLGCPPPFWNLVEPLVAAETTTVTYARAGFGASDPAADRSFAALAADLGRLLDALGDGPFVLVGHSLGGPLVQLAAAARPDRIAGLVLVDQSEEEISGFYTRTFRISGRVVYRLQRLAPALVRPVLARSMRGGLTRADAAELARQMTTRDGLRAAQAEFAHFVDGMRALQADPPQLPDVPVSIISGSKLGKRQGAQRPEVTAAHQRRAARLPQGRHVWADAGHGVPQEDPETCAREILEIVRRA